jgi:hypothetical protein
MNDSQCLRRQKYNHLRRCGRLQVLAAGGGLPVHSAVQRARRGHRQGLRSPTHQGKALTWGSSFPVSIHLSLYRSVCSQRKTSSSYLSRVVPLERESVTPPLPVVCLPILPAGGAPADASAALLRGGAGPGEGRGHAGNGPPRHAPAPAASAGRVGSPLIMHGFCVRHRVTWCALLAALGRAVGGPSRDAPTPAARAGWITTAVIWAFALITAESADVFNKRGIQQTC